MAWDVLSRDVLSYILLVYTKVEIKTAASNYRSISITSILCRMLESIIKTVIMDHCNTNNIFSDSQYGFRQKRVYTTVTESI